MIIPAPMARRLGLRPGAVVPLEEGPHSLGLGRPVSSLAQVYVEPTNACNFRCRTCMRNVWAEPSGHMSAEVFELVIAGVRACDVAPSVFFGGIGEPLLHPAIAGMVERAKALGARAELITNGVLLDERLAQSLIRCGLDRLWVSLDGATPSTYSDVRIGESLERVLRNLDVFQTLRRRAHGYQSPLGPPELGIVFVAMRRNVAELPEVLRIAARLGAKDLLVTHLLPHTPELREEILYRRGLSSSLPGPRVELPPLDVEPTAKAALAELVGQHLRRGMGAAGGPARRTCPFVQKGSVAIRWDGTVSPCLPLLHSHVGYLEDRERCSEAYSLGNLRDRPLLQIWNDPGYVSLRQRLEAFDFSPCSACNSCDMAGANVNDCIGSGTPACGGCLWARGLIRCP